MHQNFKNEFKRFKSLSEKKEKRFEVSWQDHYACFYDKTEQTNFNRHYVYHTSWAARVLSQTKPENHVDISSSLYFSAITSAFLPITFYDYRPAKIELSNLTSKAANLLNLDFKDNSISSLSCMHVVEHIGLGRYGDPIDPIGNLAARQELSRVLAPQGDLLFVVPLGKPRVIFNAHRFYSYKQVINNLAPLTLKESAMFLDYPNETELIRNPSQNFIEKHKNHDGCGCFWFKKL